MFLNVISTFLTASHIYSVIEFLCVREREIYIEIEREREKGGKKEYVISNMIVIFCLKDFYYNIWSLFAN